MLPMTIAAADLLMRLADERGVDRRLRVRVIAGGCSGLTWDLELGAPPREDDHRRVTEGVTVLVDPVSASYLRGGRIDVSGVQDNGLRTPLLGGEGTVAVVVAGLMTRNACPCGESFTPA